MHLRSGCVNGCGNGIKDPDEQCDGEDSDLTVTCVFFGFASGELRCNERDSGSIPCTFNTDYCVKE
ncbi:MAG: hypothetical protein JW741_16735 [Sedimentisphaerales bacterium]|nr:hypothetical protein [Sedimentisphaerales bacterium]